MPGLTIQLPTQADQTAFNLQRWDELVNDPFLATVEGRVETDRHGQIIMSPPPAPQHGRFQAEIAFLLKSLVRTGSVLTECPISTADGVKAADIAWVSAERYAELGNRSCFPRSPEICVEVLSPSNTEAEIAEKVSLYFDAGAREVWVCNSFGRIAFYSSTSTTVPSSKLCPNFPAQIDLPPLSD